MLSIAICDDMKSCADSLEKEIKIWAIEAGINVKTRKFDNGIPLLMCIKETGVFDLVFMDVEMPKMNGLEAAARIRKTDYITTFIFVSQYDNFFKDAYDVHPFHFLSKPVKQSKLSEVMDSYMEMKKQDIESISFSINKTQYNIPLLEIMYMYSERRHIHMICESRSFKFYGKLNDVQAYIETQNSKFLRIHQSFLVNMKYIKEYHYNKLVMSNNEVLFISKENRKKLRDIHMMFME